MTSQQAEALYQEKINALVKLHESAAFRLFIEVLQARETQINENFHTYRGENVAIAQGGKTEIRKIVGDVATGLAAFLNPEPQDTGKTDGTGSGY